MKSPDTCAWPKCRAPAEMTVAGVPLCAEDYLRGTEALHAQWPVMRSAACCCGTCRPDAETCRRERAIMNDGNDL